MRATVRNVMGIHCRPSAVIAKAAQPCSCRLSVEAATGECDPRSIMGLLSLGLEEGSEVTVRADGDDEETVCDTLVNLLETRYDFLDKAPPTSR